MTIELCTNVIQLCVCLVSAVWMTVIAFRYQRTVHIMMAGFADTFALGTLYWVSHQLITAQTPDAFYLSEISWMAAPLFLLCMEVRSAQTTTRGGWRPEAIWVYLVAGGLTVYFTMDGGDGLANLLYMGVTALCLAKALENLKFGPASGRSLHLYCILFVVVEWALWLAECIWQGDSWTNPYFWVDNLLTLTIALVIPAVKGAWDYDLS